MRNLVLSGQIRSLFPLGFCGMITYSWWANRVVSEFVDPNFRAQKWVLVKRHLYLCSVQRDKPQPVIYLHT